MFIKRSFLLYLLFNLKFVFSQSPLVKVNDSIKINKLDEIIISATRTKRKLISLPLPASIITKKEINSINSVRLNSVIEEQTGLISVPDYGGVEGIQIQGLDSQYSLILIDGFPLIGRSAGTLDLSRVTVGNVKQIEIVKGPSSSLYGNEALAGTVNIITEEPKNGFNFYTRANYRTGAFNSNDISSNLNFKNNKLGFNVFLNRFNNDGYDLDKNDNLNTVDPYKNYTLNTKLSYNFLENLKLNISTRFFHQDQRTKLDENIFGNNEIKEFNIHSRIEFKINKKWNNEFEFYITNYNVDEFLSDNFYTNLSSRDFDQKFTRPEFRSTYKIDSKNYITAGFGIQMERLKRSDFYKNPKFNSSYFYSQYEYNPNKKTSTIFGLRFDDHNEYTSQLSPKIASRTKINKDITIKGSIGYGFKTPDFRQLYFDFTNTTVGYTVLGYNAVAALIPQLESNGELLDVLVPLSSFDSELNPESSIGCNFGIDLKLNPKIKINLNLFRNEIDNLIDTRVIARKINGQNVFSYYNVKEIYTQGIEFNSSYEIENINLSLGYQLLYAKDKAAEKAFKNGEVFTRLTPTSPLFALSKKDYFGLFNRSRHVFNFKIFYTIPKWNLDTNFRVVYRSKFGLYDSNGNGYLDTYDEFVNGYSILDFAINKILLDSFRIGLGLDNLLDFKDSANLSNIPGRISYCSIKYNF